MKIIALVLLMIVSLLSYFGLYQFQKGHFSSRPRSRLPNFSNSSDLFSSSCECRSLFTIGFCANASRKIEDFVREKKSFWSKLRQLHQGKYLFAHDLYKRLSRYLDSNFKMTFENETLSDKKNIVKKIQARHSFVKLKPQQLPYIPCKQIIYTPEKAKSCVEKFDQLAGRPLRIVFMGDSTIRVYMEAIISDFNSVFDFQFMGSNFKLDVNENFLNNKAKYNIPIQGHGIQLQFYWAPFLQRASNVSHPFFQGARDTIERWVHNSHEPDLPDIIYLTYGMWHAVYMDQEDSLPFYSSSLNKMSRLLRQLSLKTKVLFHVTPPVKHWLLKENAKDPMKMVDYINQLKFLQFPNTNILMWDSSYPVAIKEIEECATYSHLDKLLNVSTPKELGCTDFMHVGSTARRTGNNMVWNLICNKIMNRGHKSCCS